MLTRQQAWAVLALTLMWGFNWPMMKLSLQEITPLYFRACTMGLGGLWLWAYFARRGDSLWPAPGEWGLIGWLMLPNILGWHTLSIMGVQELASGRAATLGFTMPIFAVLLGALFYQQPVTRRTGLAIACVAATIGLLLWHEGQRLSGRPAGVFWMVSAAFFWALGTLQFRRARFSLSASVVTVWMLLIGSVLVGLLAAALEPLPQPAGFSRPMWLSLAYGVVINFGVAQLIWFGMARDLPPATSAISIMAIPLIGTIAATWLVGEVPHWQDWLSMVFVMLAIASVMWPSRAARLGAASGPSDATNASATRP